MDVTVIFDEHFKGNLLGSVWILDTEPNRKKFQQTTGLDPNSALFSIDNYNSIVSALSEMIWSVHDHFPDLETIFVRGASFELSAVEHLRKDYNVSSVDNGFVFRPNEAS